MQIVVLGAAAGGGFPQWNCYCEGCQAARNGDADTRTQASIAVSNDGETWFLVNASPDLRQQINSTLSLHPQPSAGDNGVRHSPIAGVILTGADVDQIAGLLTLRESSPFTLWGTERILQTLKSNSIFNALNPDFVTRKQIRIGTAFELTGTDGAASGLTAEPFAVPGKVALYLEDESKGADFGTVQDDTVGLCISDKASDKHVFLIPSCAAMSPELAERLRGADLVLFDGTVWHDDEMSATNAGHKTGSRMGHMFMAGAGGSIEAFRELTVKRRVYIHINNTNPVLRPGSSERATAEAAGWEIAEDGMEITL